MNFNKKKIKRILITLSIISSIIIINCDSPANIDFSKHKSQLVANSFFNPDSVWTVNLSSSIGAFEDDEIKVINNAEVEIWNNDILLATLPNVGEGKFQISSLKPVAGGKYTLKVYSQGYDNIRAEEITPFVVSIESVESNISIDTSQNNFTANISINFTFADLSSVLNFYTIALFINTNEVTNLQAWLSTSDEVVLESVRDIFSEEPGDEYSSHTFLFSDKLFNGQHKTINISSEFFMFEEENITEIKLVLSNISKAYYDYTRTMELKLYRGNDPFAEPVLIYENIENGLGIFAGYNSSSATIQVDDKNKK